MDYPVQNAMLQLSGICNYRCSMCGHASKNHGMMSDQVFSRILEDCQQRKIHTFIFAGAWGEPTLHPKWKEFICKGIAHGFRVILSTNGSRLDSDAIAFLATSGLKSLQVSFAGYDQESYESTYVHGDFLKMMHVLASLKKVFLAEPYAPEIVINGVIAAATTDPFVDRTYTFLYSCGYTDQEIQMILPYNFAGKRKDITVVQNEFEKASGKLPLTVCHVLRDTVGIFWDGRVTACACLDNDGKMEIGNILGESINDMRKGNSFLKMLDAFRRKDLSMIEMCSQCDVPYRNYQEMRVLPTWLRSLTGICTRDDICKK